MTSSCSTCGTPCVAVVTHSIRVETNRLTGAGRWVQWSSCAGCEAADQRRWDEQRRDEARERQAREERSRKAAQRDAERVEKQRSQKQVSA